MLSLVTEKDAGLRGARRVLVLHISASDGRELCSGGKEAGPCMRACPTITKPESRVIDERAREFLGGTVIPSASVGSSCRGFISCALRSMRFPIARMSLTFDVVGFFTERS